MSNDIQESGAKSGAIINAKAKKAIDVLFDGIKASAGLAKAKDNHQGACGLMMEGLCLALQNGVLPDVALREISGRVVDKKSGARGQDFINGMMPSDRSALNKVAEGIMLDVMIPVRGGGSASIRSQMKATTRKTKAGLTKTEWPSLQGIAGKVRAALDTLKLADMSEAEKKAADKAAAKDKADADIKRADNTIKHFGSISRAVREMALAIKVDADSAAIDKQKAKVLAHVASLSPKQIEKLAADLSLK